MTKANYKELVEQAESAVASVSDPGLKQIAFQKVLDALLSTTDGPKQSRHATPNPQSSKRSDKKQGKSGPSAYVEELINDGFFSSKKSLVQALEELANRGHRMRTSDAGVVLLRLCKAKKLRRKKEGKSYMYSNW